MSGDFYDRLETRSTDEREAAQMAALSAQVALAKGKTAYFGKLLSDIDPGTITSRAALTGLPVTRKGDLLDLQKSTPPFDCRAKRPCPALHVPRPDLRCGRARVRSLALCSHALRRRVPQGRHPA